jgi:isopentenyldiphosphate isomerase
MGGDISLQFEVLDEQGHKTGQILDRETVHEHQLWHAAVNVWIINNTGEVLLQLRGPAVEINPGVWDVAIGTHVRPAEDPGDAAVRCLLTELGVTIAKDQLKHLFNLQSSYMVSSGKMHRTLGHVFLLKRDMQLSDFTYDTEKIADLAWKPIIEVMGEIGGSDTVGKYFPRSGDYYPQLFDALQAEMQS